MSERLTADISRDLRAFAQDMRVEHRNTDAVLLTEAADKLDGLIALLAEAEAERDQARSDWEYRGHQLDDAAAVGRALIAERDEALADSTRLRARVHEAVDECQRRHAKYVSRCDQFDTWSAWARAQFERAGDPVNGYNYWQMTSEANRLLMLSWQEERDAVAADRDRLARELVTMTEVARSNKRYVTNLAEQLEEQDAEAGRLSEIIRKVREIHSPPPGWEREWKDPAKALAQGWPPCAGCATVATFTPIGKCRTRAALGDIPSPTAPEALGRIEEQWTMRYLLNGKPQLAEDQGHTFDSRAEAKRHIDAWRTFYPKLDYTDVEYLRRTVTYGPWQPAPVEPEGTPDA